CGCSERHLGQSPGIRVAYSEVPARVRRVELSLSRAALGKGDGRGNMMVRLAYSAGLRRPPRSLRSPAPPRPLAPRSPLLPPAPTGPGRGTSGVSSARAPRVLL